MDNNQGTRPSPRRRPPRRQQLRWTEDVTAEVAYLLVGQLLQAIETRDLIGQAKGVLMGRYHIDADEAFERLVAESQRRSVRLTTVARRVVTSTARRVVTSTARPATPVPGVLGAPVLAPV